MQIQIVWPWEIVEDLEGIAVVADVWGATTNISLLLDNKVDKLILVNSNNVIKAKNLYTNALIIGESPKFPKYFFHTSNYPSDVALANVLHKTVLYMSNNGTRIIELAYKKGAKKVLPVSFKNIAAVASYLRSAEEKIYLLPAGDLGRYVDEDMVCMQSLEKLIKNEHVNLTEAQEKAKLFISDFYGNEVFDKNANFKVTFNANSTNVLAEGNKNQQGFLEIQHIK